MTSSDDFFETRERSEEKLTSELSWEPRDWERENLKLSDRRSTLFADQLDAALSCSLTSVGWFTLQRFVRPLEKKTTTTQSADCVLVNKSN